MDANSEHANMVLTLIGLGALTLGTLAMIYRGIRQWLLNRETTAGALAAQLVDDVKRGEGFTFMSRRPAAVPDSPHIAAEQRSQAQEQPGNRAEHSDGTWFRSLIADLEQCSDDELLALLAQLRGADGDFRYAESRVAKFIGGRIEDRIDQVRDVRGTTPPQAPGRVLRVRDDRGERVIPMDVAAKR